MPSLGYSSASWPPHGRQDTAIHGFLVSAPV